MPLVEANRVVSADRLVEEDADALGHKEETVTQVWEAAKLGDRNRRDLAQRPLRRRAEGAEKK